MKSVNLFIKNLRIDQFYSPIQVQYNEGCWFRIHEFVCTHITLISVQTAIYLTPTYQQREESLF